ncbi:MAG: amino acid permease [Atopobium sp.]|uniref:amino acid permease n=1 Tax=Atopobium sp. TaxID=1872650 RepID=UPI002A75E22A|nr:amino acid permease [Atopobium sp.]MDY2788968.1 amino acid permease [Atopobium sp.]
MSDSTNSVVDNEGGVGFFGLVGLVVSSCIGSGVFALTGQLANVASPGAALIAWLVCGLGFLFLALSLANLGGKRPDLDGCVAYAEEGFGPLHGFISGWGYWLSAWLGNVGFATMLAQVLGSDYCLGGLLPGIFSDPATGNPAIIGVVAVSAMLWGLTYLVLRGVESASTLNAIVMVVKIASILLFVCFAVISFKAGIFTADFWGTAERNAVIMAANESGLGGVANQVTQCILIMMWVFIGIEGASVMSARARRKSEIGSATIVGLIVLLVLYIGASVIPYGVMPYDQLVAAPKPATISVFEFVAPGWGGAFISWAIVVSVLGSWLSFTMLPAETSSMMSNHGLLPKSWDVRNKFNAPQMSLIIVGICTQVFIVIATFAADAYTFAISMCTVTIVVTWAYAAAYQLKYSMQQGNTLQMLFGILALVFQVVGVLFTGWGFLLLACLGYVPGWFFYRKARIEEKKGLSKTEVIVMIIITLLGVISIPLTVIGIIPVF